MQLKVVFINNSELNKKIANRRKVIRLLVLAIIKIFCSMHFLYFKCACFQT